MAKLDEILKTINRLNYGNFPKYIYKFLPVNEFLFKNILNHQLWFSNPLSFNDPFDCQYGEFCGISEKQIELIDKGDEKFDSRDLIKTANETMRNLKVSCFCDINKMSRELLLWSHYADSHKGICIKYNLEELRKFCNENNYDINIHKVHYSSIFPSVPIFYDEYNKNLRALLDILYTKSSDWDYEQEIRIFHNNNKLIFNKGLIVEIQFGCKIEIDNRNDIMQLVKSCNYPNIIFKQAIKSEERYKLEFEVI